MLATGGGTKHTERAVTAALVWLANHQMSDGSWSLQNFQTSAAAATRPAPARARSRPMPAQRPWASCPSWPPGKRTSPRALIKEHILKGITG